MRTFSDYIHGKRVSIIGGAPSFDADAFDADVVIRVNEHAITQGGKCDVVYTSLANDPQQLFKAGIIKNLRWLMADRRGRHFSTSLAAQLDAHRVGYFDYSTVAHRADDPLHRLEEFWLQRALNQYHCKPFTGIVALLHVLALPARSVYLTGCDFYAKDGQVPNMRHSHAIQPNREIVADLLQWDRRLKVDAACEAALTLPIVVDLTDAITEPSEQEA